MIVISSPKSKQSETVKQTLVQFVGNNPIGINRIPMFE